MHIEKSALSSATPKPVAELKRTEANWRAAVGNPQISKLESSLQTLKASKAFWISAEGWARESQAKTEVLLRETTTQLKDAYVRNDVIANITKRLNALSMGVAAKLPNWVAGERGNEGGTTEKTYSTLDDKIDCITLIFSFEESIKTDIPVFVSKRDDVHNPEVVQAQIIEMAPRFDFMKAETDGKDLLLVDKATNLKIKIRIRTIGAGPFA